MSAQVLIIFVLFASLVSPVAGQDDACWALVPSEWQWAPTERSPDPPHEPEQGTVTWVPSAFALTDSPGRGFIGNELENYSAIEARAGGPDARSGIWQVRSDSLFVDWGSGMAGFSAAFPDFSAEEDAVQGVAGEYADHLPGRWVADAELRRVECPPRGDVL